MAVLLVDAPPVLAGAAPPGMVAPGVVAAESVYGGLARQIGGPAVPVDVILSNPAQDPHLFEAGPAAARALTGARIVVYNGADYDPWMRSLLASTGGAGPRQVIDVADLAHVGAGANPHLWYDPANVRATAAALANALEVADPAGAAGYTRNLAGLRQALDALEARIGRLRARTRGVPVTATEPVFGLMAARLGFEDRNQAFQRAVMNDTEPSPEQLAGMEQDLRGRRVRILFRNSQTDDAATRRLVSIARDAGVPVVDVTESEPARTSYTEWMGATLDRVERALDAAPARPRVP